MPQTSPAGAYDPYRLGLEALRSRNFAAAIVHFQQASASRPNDPEPSRMLGHVLREQGDLAGAAQAFEKVLALRPTHAEAHLFLADAKRRLGMPALSIAHCDAAIARSHSLGEAWLTRGIALHELGDHTGAMHDIETSLRYAKSFAAYQSLGVLLTHVGRHAEALPHLDRAAKMEPRNAQVMTLLGNCHNALGNVQDAIRTYLEVTHIDPNRSEAFTNLCGLLCHTGQIDMAISSGEIAIRLSPDDADARYNLAVAYELGKRRVDALIACGEALRCRPDHGRALYYMCILMRQDCMWDGIEEAQELALNLTFRADPPKPITPFSVLWMTDRPEDSFAAARAYGTSHVHHANPPLALYAPRPAQKRDGRIRIGYLSSDFYDHATAILMVQLLEIHDRSRFEIFGYSIGYTDDRAITARVTAAVDHFVDLNTYSHVEAAKRIRADDIDILIDLKGYTYQARPEILSFRPAPIQVNFLGYPGTMGVPFIDYILVDHIVAPREHAAFYTEKQVHLPNAYQPNDRKRLLVTERPPRHVYGLPEEGFVFCCFNANNKIGPHIFDVWMRLLAATPGSVVWLLASNERAPDNLRKEAVKRGVDPSRLVFAPRVKMEEHLIRMGHADLFLDTHPYGAHTTASEALWCALPVVTFLGQSFQSRVAASLLTAAGVPELIAPDLAGYEELALRLAHDPQRIAELKKKLDEGRMRVPLFDTERFVASYEAALQRMIDLRDEGVPPGPIQIEG